MDFCFMPPQFEGGLTLEVDIIADADLDLFIVTGPQLAPVDLCMEALIPGYDLRAGKATYQAELGLYKRMAAVEKSQSSALKKALPYLFGRARRRTANES